MAIIVGFLAEPNSTTGTNGRVAREAISSSVRISQPYPFRTRPVSSWISICHLGKVMSLVVAVGGFHAAILLSKSDDPDQMIQFGRHLRDALTHTLLKSVGERPSVPIAAARRKSLGQGGSKDDPEKQRAFARQSHGVAVALIVGPCHILRHKCADVFDRQTSESISLAQRTARADRVRASGRLQSSSGFVPPP